MSVSAPVVLIAAAAAVCFIWGNSIMPASESDAISKGLVAFLSEKLGNVSFIEVPDNNTMRKIAHAVEFSVLGMIVTVLLRGIFRAGCGWTLAAGMAVALTDETIQMFSSGRSSSVRDVWIDTGGFVCGMLAVLAVMLLWRAVRRD